MFSVTEMHSDLCEAEQAQTGVLMLSFPVLSPVKPLASEDNRTDIELSVTEECTTLADVLIVRWISLCLEVLQGHYHS